jgi:uncharacterized protein YyaL (SSP411 family)
MMPWTAEAFARAKKENKPVLLQLCSGASSKSRELDLAFKSPALGAAAGLFVRVRVDADERPDIAGRFSGAPGTAVFVVNHDGSLFERLAFTDPERFALALTDCAKVFAPASPKPVEAKPVWTGAVAEAGDPPVPADFSEKTLAAVKKGDHGDAHCFDCLDLLLYASGEWKDGQAQQVLVTRLRELIEGPGWDRKGGGWAPPHTDKTLSVNARLCRLLWDAYSLTGLDVLGNAASEVSAFLLRDLYDDDPGGFRHFGPRDDRRVYFGDANALAALALLKGAAFEDGRTRLEAASKTLVFLSQLCDSRRGMAHSWSEGTGAVYGLLADNSWAMLALCEGFLMSGHRAHRELADSLLRNLLQESWHRERGGFFDRVASPDDIGSLREPLILPAANAPALEATWMLHELKGNDNYKRWIEWGLRHLVAKAGEDACAAAPLARIHDMVKKGRVDLELVGRLGEPSTEAFLAAVHRHYVPRKIISFVDPDDQDYILAHKLKAPTFPRLFGCVDLRPKAMADKPDQVGDVLKAVRVD